MAVQLISGMEVVHIYFNTQVAKSIFKDMLQDKGCRSIALGAELEDTLLGFAIRSDGVYVSYARSNTSHLINLRDIQMFHMLPTFEAVFALLAEWVPSEPVAEISTNLK